MNTVLLSNPAALDIGLFRRLANPGYGKFKPADSRDDPRPASACRRLVQCREVALVCHFT